MYSESVQERRGEQDRVGEGQEGQRVLQDHRGEGQSAPGPESRVGDRDDVHAL